MWIYKYILLSRDFRLCLRLGSVGSTLWGQEKKQCSLFLSCSVNANRTLINFYSTQFGGRIVTKTGLVYSDKNKLII